MIKILRRITFFLFTAVFLIGAPKIIFYALGYNYQLGSKQGLTQTGLIYLSTTPPGATVYVNGRRYRELTPTVIRDLLPGNYAIRLSLKGYELWSQVVPVQEGKPSVLGKVLLRTQKPDWKVRSAHAYQAMRAIPQTPYLLLQPKDENKSVHLYDMRSREMRPLFLDSAQLHFSLQNFHFVSDSPYSVLEARQGEQVRLIGLDFTRLGTKKIIWEMPFETSLDQILWEKDDFKYGFALREGVLTRFDPQKKEQQILPLPPIRGFQVENHKIFYMAGDTFSNTDYAAKNSKPIWKDAESFLGNEKLTKIENFPDETTLFLSADGRFATNHPPRLIESSGVRGFQFDKKNRRALFWKDHAIGVVHFIDFKNEQGKRDAEINIQWIHQSGKKILRAYFAHDGAYTLFQDQNKVYLAELETFGLPVTVEVLEAQGDTEVYYTDELGQLFYLDKKTGYLMSLEIIPKWKVLEVPRAILEEKIMEDKVRA